MVYKLRYNLDVQYFTKYTRQNKSDHSFFILMYQSNLIVTYFFLKEKMYTIVIYLMSNYKSRNSFLKHLSEQDTYYIYIAKGLNENCWTIFNNFIIWWPVFTRNFKIQFRCECDLFNMKMASQYEKGTLTIGLRPLTHLLGK